MFNTVKKITAILGSFSLLLLPFTPLSVSADQGMVYVYDNYYSPQTITVPVGSTVMWMNNGSMNHTVTSDSSFFNSGTLTPGSSYSITFNTPGTYSYHCMFHSEMHGTVVVTSQDGSGGNQYNNGSGTLVGTVGQSGSSIVINSITPVRTSATADGTYQNGWEWIFDVTVPFNEQNVAMKFDNWLQNNGGYTIPVAQNLRFFSPQSSNASNENTAIVITGANTYSQSMFLTGNLGGSPSGTRRVQIRVQARIPQNTVPGSYSTSFGIRTQ